MISTSGIHFEWKLERIPNASLFLIMNGRKWEKMLDKLFICIHPWKARLTKKKYPRLLRIALQKWSTIGKITIFELTNDFDIDHTDDISCCGFSKDLYEHSIGIECMFDIIYSKLADFKTIVEPWNYVVAKDKRN